MCDQRFLVFLLALAGLPAIWASELEEKLCGFSQSLELLGYKLTQEQELPLLWEGKNVSKVSQADMNFLHTIQQQVVELSQGKLPFLPGEIDLLDKMRVQCGQLGGAALNSDPTDTYKTALSQLVGQLKNALADPKRLVEKEKGKKPPKDYPKLWTDADEENCVKSLELGKAMKGFKLLQELHALLAKCNKLAAYTDEQKAKIGGFIKTFQEDFLGAVKQGMEVEDSALLELKKNILDYQSKLDFV
jgi:hypothetical protein